jgi:hypothetical protein
MRMGSFAKRVSVSVTLAVLLVACQPDRLLVVKPTEAPTPTATIAPVTLTPQSDVLRVFPLVPGTSWTYRRSNYTQAENDPNTLLTAETQLVETILSSEQAGAYLFVKFHRGVTLSRVDAGWGDTTGLGLGNFDNWYVVTDDKVYSSTEKPAAQTLQLDLLIEEYAFPMTVGASWCPNRQQKGYDPTDAPAETPVPCAFAGARTVQGLEAVHTPAGDFDECYRLSDFYNSGGVVQWFCDGVGVVAQKYDHLGSRFGYSSELVKFTRGAAQ